MTGAADRADRLARNVAALADPAMRVAYAGHELAALEPGDAADIVLVAATRAEANEPPFHELWMALCLALADPEAAPLKQRVIHGAEARGHETVVNLLSERPSAVPEAAKRVPDFGKGRPLTLGERKSVARTHDRNLVARALRDPHPDVIRILLGNPILTEDDVVRLAARRPIDPDTLRQVFRAPRWVVRRRVRMALVLNPHTPRDVALQLLPQLTGPDCRRVARSAELDVELRKAALRGVAGSDEVH